MPGLTATPMLPLANYLYQGAAKVQGWLWPTTGTILAQVLVKQVQSGQQGDVCEVGVHHGKSFLVLANGIVAGERAVAVDVFGDQHKNVDQSGAGDRAVFEANLAAYAPAAAVEIIQRSSLELGPDWSPRPRFRLFSIDGGHTAQATANDLRLAERTALPGCVVALDDVFNTTWTGVITGLVDYTAAGGRLIPFAIVPNKLLLTTDAEHALAWRTRLQREVPLAYEKANEFMAGQVDTYVEHPYYNYELYAGLQQQAEALTRERDGLAAQVAELQRAYAAVQGSTSWRVTAPLRSTKTLFRSPVR